MIFKNATVLNADFRFVRTDLTVENGVIAAVGKTDAPGRDLGGDYVIPGLVDIHTHGAMGSDHLDGTPQATAAIRSFMAAHGTTSLLATLMTQSRETMVQAAANVAACAGQGAGAHIRGIYAEGPFFSEAYRGAQHPQYLCDPDPALVLQLQEASGGRVRILSLAPERAGAVELIRRFPKIRFFIGHTDADYAQAKAAIAAGACGLTHTFNGMRGLHHRSPNALGAALESDGVYCECICDGFHVHPAVVGLLYRLVGRERFAVISDSLRPAGLPDGEYTSGGQPITVREGHAFLHDGTIAGSSTYLLEEVRNLVRWGIMPLEDAVYAASAVPAKAAGLFDRIGSIAPGKAADLLILSPELALKETLIGAE